MSDRKLIEVKRLEIVESYKVKGVTTYKALLEIPWEKSHGIYIFDPQDKKVFTAAEVRDWTTGNPKYQMRQLLLLEFPEEKVRRIYK